MTVRSSEAETNSTPKQWGLWVRGRILTRFILADEHGDEIGRIKLSGWPKPERQAQFIELDGTRWIVRLGESELEAVREGTSVATVRREELRIGREQFEWSVQTNGSRKGRVLGGDRARELFNVRPDSGKHGPWAVMRLYPDLPEPLAVALITSALLLRVDGDAAQIGSTLGGAAPPG